MSAIEAYSRTVQSQLEAIDKTQRSHLERASAMVALTLQEERFIYVFGSGHSHTLAEEVFYRAGGLARCVPMLDEKLMVHESASESTEWERKEEYAAKVLARYPITKGDVLVVVSNSGRNGVPIELAFEVKRRGAKTIAITSLAHSSGVASRHSSGKKLYEVVDVAIDNCGVAGDATVQIGALPKVGPTSTITSAFIVNSIIAGAVDLCAEIGFRPEIYESINSENTGNEALLKKYKGVIPHL